MEKTIKELQQVAKENGFYLCPESVWNRMAIVMENKDRDIKRARKGRDNWKRKFDELKGLTINKKQVSHVKRLKQETITNLFGSS